MGIIIKTDVFPEILDEGLENKKVIEKCCESSSEKYCLREMLLSLLIFASGIAFGFLLANFL